jgi:hypothetical protein
MIRKLASVIVTVLWAVVALFAGGVMIYSLGTGYVARAAAVVEALLVFFAVPYWLASFRRGDA